MILFAKGSEDSAIAKLDLRHKNLEDAHVSQS